MRTIDHGGSLSKAITMDIDDIQNKSTAIRGLSADLGVSVGTPPAGRTPAAYAAALSTAAEIDQTLQRCAKNLDAMGSMLDKRIKHMIEFGKDYPSTFATASDAKRYGQKLASQFKKDGKLDIEAMKSLTGDVDASYAFVHSLSAGDLTQLLNTPHIAYVDGFADMKAVMAMLNGLDGLSRQQAAEVHAKLFSAASDLDAIRTYRILGLLNGGLGDDGHPAFRAGLVGIFASLTFAKLDELDGQTQVGDSQRRSALQAFVKATNREDVAGSIMSHSDTLGAVVTADAVTKDINSWVIDEDTDRKDFTSAVIKLMQKGWSPPSEAKYNAITDAVNRDVARIVDDSKRSMPNDIANLLAGSMFPYIIDPTHAAAHLAGSASDREATLLRLGNALAVLGQGGGQDTRDAISAFIEMGQRQNWSENGRSPEGARLWVALDSLRSQLDAVFKAHGMGMRTFNDAEHLSKTLDYYEKLLGWSSYFPKTPFLVGAIAQFSSGQIDGERDRLDEAARYEQQVAEYLTYVKEVDSESDLHAMAHALAQRTKNPPPNFERDLYELLLELRRVPLRSL